MKSVFICTFLLLFIAAQPVLAQTAGNNSAAQKTEQILSALVFGDLTKRSSVEMILLSHLDALDKVFKDRKAAMAAANDLAAQDKERAEARSQKAWDAAAGKLNKLHATFLGKLSSLLAAAQVEVVKDVMTENGMQAEYNRFLELLPNLAEQQKDQVKTYLKEARENAMVAETEDIRKQWFIKYRGRANNYLAAAGYDLQKATADLERKKHSGQTPKP